MSSNIKKVCFFIHLQINSFAERRGRLCKHISTTQNSNNYLFFMSIYKYENAVARYSGAYCNFPAVTSLQTIYDKIDTLSMKWFFLFALYDTSKIYLSIPFS